jgi:hypothetical protein
MFLQHDAGGGGAAHHQGDHPPVVAAQRFADSAACCPEFVPGRKIAGARQTFGELDAWLAHFGPDVLFTVTVSRTRRCAVRKRTICRDERHRQVTAAGVRRLAERHGAHVRKIEPEAIGAAAWTAAIERWGACE